MAVPDLVPARMINEFSYCQRLFYIEWVQARFADNADTVDGSYRHRRVDRESGDIRDDGPFTASSVTLASKRLGIVARADLITGDGAVVVPVDQAWRGSGQPRAVLRARARATLRDRSAAASRGSPMRLRLRLLLQQQNRVRVDFTEDPVERTQDILRQVGEVASRDVAPPPLVDSPKCLRCSVVGLCLPDETTLSHRAVGAAARRILPGDSDARPLHVTQHGSYVSKAGNRVVVKMHGEEMVSIRLRDISQICLVGECADQHSVDAHPVCQGHPGAVVLHRWLAQRRGHKSSRQERRTAAETIFDRCRGGLDVAVRMIAGQDTQFAHHADAQRQTAANQRDRLARKVGRWSTSSGND